MRQALGAANAFQAVRDLQYDAFNRVECAATRMNPASWSNLTAGCTLQTTGSDGPDRISRTLYTLAGEVYQQQAAYGTSAAAIVSTSSYTLNGRLTTLTDANSNVTTYTYDGHDRQRRTCFAQTASSACATATGTGFEQITYEDTGSLLLERRRRRLRYHQRLSINRSLGRQAVRHPHQVDDQGAQGRDQRRGRDRALALNQSPQRR